MYRKYRERSPRIVRSWVIAVGILLIGLASSSAAAAAVLYDQTDSAGGFTAASSDYPTANDNFDSQTADDFTVPAGESWQISQLDVLGVAGGTPPSTVNVFIYANAGTLPGAELFHENAVTATGNPNFSIPVTGAPSLTPGTYWISAQLAGADFGHDWSWTERSIQSGNPAAFRNGGAYSGTCTTNWGVRTTCFPGGLPDQIFKLSGTSAVYPPPSPPTPSPGVPSNQFTLGKPHSKPNGTATLPATFPGAGLATLQDAKVHPRAASASAAYRPLIKKSTVTVAAAGTVLLKIKPTARARAILDRGRPVKAKVRVTYTPSGGSSNAHTVKVNLKKG